MVCIHRGISAGSRKNVITFLLLLNTLLKLVQSAITESDRESTGQRKAGPMDLENEVDEGLSYETEDDFNERRIVS